MLSLQVNNNSTSYLPAPRAFRVETRNVVVSPAYVELGIPLFVGEAMDELGEYFVLQSLPSRPHARSLKLISNKILWLLHNVLYNLKKHIAR